MANWGKILSRGNVEDRRGVAPAAIGGLSLTSVAFLLLFNYLAGGDLSDALNQVVRLPASQPQYTNTKEFEGEDAYETFASTVLGSNNEAWSRIFNRNNREYTAPTLVLFRAATESGCGTATSEVGPHYCPIDNTVYLDETFFDELTNRFGAQGGDVAEAYVIAHEVGHHVQNQLGTMEKVQANQQYDAASSNDLSIKLELQADCYAGIWANSIKDAGVFNQDEIHEAMDAAAAVGDDRIQQRVAGYVNPESWTHGSSDQRVTWFNKGYNSGNPSVCNTF